MQGARLYTYSPGITHKFCDVPNVTHVNFPARDSDVLCAAILPTVCWSYRMWRTIKVC